jgi:hypothetical protein
VDTKNLHSAVDLGKIAIWHILRRLEANTNLEASRAPINELDGTLRLESGDSGVNVLGHNIATVQQTGSHVLAIARITFYHLVVGLEAGH